MKTTTDNAVKELKDAGCKTKKIGDYRYTVEKNGVRVDWWPSTNRWRKMPQGPSGDGIRSLLLCFSSADQTR